MRKLRAATLLMPLAGAAGICGGLASATADAAPERRGGETWTPDSSMEQANQVGHRAHTNFKFFIPTEEPGATKSHAGSPDIGGPPYNGYLYETPASIACIYNLVPQAAGCDPNQVSITPSGGARAIAVVDAYHYPTAQQDLATFSAQFNLPFNAPPTDQTLTVVYANGQQPAVNGNWNVEAALDIEWAHAMAPKAKMYLVEAASNNLSDLLQAVSVANNLLYSAAGGEVSMSWGGSEFGSESSYDGYFAQPSVVYLAAAGDSPGVSWPAASPRVVSVGGTSISRNNSTGVLQTELTWQSGGGGPSQYEARPAYQNNISSIVQTQRGTPDVAADANPSTGVWVYASPYWYIIGGTSLATPIWAGIINAAASQPGGSFAANTAAELGKIYGAAPGSAEYDVTEGSCGPNQGYLSVAGWDFCTGVGTPRGWIGR